MTIRADRPSLELRRVTAEGLADVDLAWHAGESLALVVDADPAPILDLLVGLREPVAGSIAIAGAVCDGRERRGRLRVLPEDASAMLDDRSLVSDLVAQSLRAPDDSAVDRALDRVGLAHAHRARRASTLTLPERTRAALACVLVGEPEGIVLAEPFARLAAADRWSLLGAVAREHRQHGRGLLLLTRSPAVAWALADRVAVLVKGRLVELGPTANVLLAPAHPATRDRVRTAGAAERAPEPPASWPPPPARPGPGCIYAASCDRARERCKAESPSLGPAGSALQLAACWYPIEALPSTSR